MEPMYGFELLNEQNITELKTAARLYRHMQTGAELLSLINDDSNKVFGITFRTPPSDSTGVAHIMEHSVLCGSNKYPVKEPFVELLKGSLQTFLNALTYPDKTCYPLASQNLQDFYNLIDVYLDAVFYPRLTLPIFQQEAWHYELEDISMPLTCKGVVFNEMKGVYSSPESLLAEFSQQSLFPDNTYGLDSGGDPEKIPHLSYAQFENFHKNYYHPSNCRIYFYGDDDPQERLRLVNQYLKDFNSIKPESTITQQPHFDRPRRTTKPFPCGDGNQEGRNGMFAVNWLLTETTDIEANMALSVLEYILLGMPASPLRKALIDSGLGEGIAGIGLESALKQMYFSTGLKGIAVEDVEKAETLILETLSNLSQKGIDPRTVKAAVNTIEFRLRENNSGRFPRGLFVMLAALTTWLYDGDPFSLLAFEAPLNRLKSRINSDSAFFEELIDEYFIKNLHRTTLTLKPDFGMAAGAEQAEKEKLAGIRSEMRPEGLKALADNTRELKQIQQTPDPPEALAAIPRLKLSDIERENHKIPLECLEKGGTKVLFHDLFSSEIFYFDVGLNLHLLPQKYLPYVALFGRALLETGTEKEDFVSLSQRISQETGGIISSLFTSAVRDRKSGTAWLFLRGKAMLPAVSDLLAILSDVLLSARLDNRKRLKQILLEEKANQEKKVIPLGHQIVNSRLRSHFNEADWADEQMHGVSYLLFLRNLEKKIDTNWKDIHRTLEEIRQRLLNRSAMLLNVTVDGRNWSTLESRVLEFQESFPQSAAVPVTWTPPRLLDCEGMLVPSLVNFVGKGADLYASGYSYKGCVHVITHFLRTSWLWERVRVQGGAYGANCHFDSRSGGFTFVSYRDPNLLKTIEVFDQTARFLSGLEMQNDELQKSIIGAIGDIDAYMLPDAMGYVSMQRYLNNSTDASRQKMREEILDTTPDDFIAFGDILQEAWRKTFVKVLGAENIIRQANQTKEGFLSTFKVL